jgi:hypothetical protein
VDHSGWSAGQALLYAGMVRRVMMVIPMDRFAMANESDGLYLILIFGTTL